MKTKEIPFENLTAGFLMEFQQDGGKGIVDGDKRVLRIIPEEVVDDEVVDDLERKPTESPYLASLMLYFNILVVFQAILKCDAGGIKK